MSLESVSRTGSSLATPEDHTDHTINSKQHKMQKDRLTITTSHIRDESFQVVIMSDIKHLANKEKLFTFRKQISFFTGTNHSSMFLAVRIM